MAKRTNNGGGSSGYNKFAFFTMVAAAVLYLVAAILAMFNYDSALISLLRQIVVAILYILISIKGYQYIKNKSSTYKLLYFIVLLIIIAAFILPQL